MRLSEPRIPPLSDEDANDEQRAILDQARQRGRARVLNVQRTIARYPALARARGLPETAARDRAERMLGRSMELTLPQG